MLFDFWNTLSKKRNDWYMEQYLIWFSYEWTSGSELTSIILGGKKVENKIKTNLGLCLIFSRNSELTANN